MQCYFSVVACHFHTHAGLWKLQKQQPLKQRGHSTLFDERLFCVLAVSQSGSTVVIWYFHMVFLKECVMKLNSMAMLILHKFALSERGDSPKV